MIEINKGEKGKKKRRRRERNKSKTWREKKGKR
jgi:hypothetical protein